MATWVCKRCEKSFEAYLAHGKDRVYCSRECARWDKMKQRDTRTCATCGKSFERIAHWRPPKHGRYFCSRKCVEAFSGDRHWNATPKGRRWQRNQYWYIRLTDTEVAEGIYRPRSGLRCIPEHIYKAERVLRRPLGPTEVVHHMDADSLNNNNGNLLICDRRYHAWLHGEMSRRYAQEKFGKKEVA